MKTAFDIDGIMFRLLNGNTSVNGGVFVGDTRPENTTTEDIVVNTIAIEQDALPQKATSSVNIYVPDAQYKIGERMQLSANRTRLNDLTQEVLRLIRKADIYGVKLIPGNMEIMNEPEIKQHFVNIRVEWNIQTN